MHIAHCSGLDLTLSECLATPMHYPPPLLNTIHKHTHARAHTHTHAHTHARIHANKNTPLTFFSPTHTLARARACTHARSLATSDRVWFVWRCANVRDLRWCWRTLQACIVAACSSGAIDVPADGSAATSSTLGWLGVSIYVSRAGAEPLSLLLKLLPLRFYCM